MSTSASVPLARPLSGVWAVVSLFLGLVDQLVPFLYYILGDQRPKFFAKNGFGNIDQYIKYRDETTAALQSGNYQKRLTEKDIVYMGKPQQSGGVTIQEASFLSPCAALLPQESKNSFFTIVRPMDIEACSSSSPPVYVVLLAATGEMSRKARINMARRLAANHGWSSIILTAPYYGRRKPAGQNLFLVDSVYDILLQSQASLEEATLLSWYFLDQDPQTLMCHSGFSWGGAMAACTSAFCMWRDPDIGQRIACAPYVGCHSPICLADGILQGVVDYPALAATKGNNTNLSVPSAEQELYKIFSEQELISVTLPIDQTSKDRRTIGVVRGASMQHDGFVIPKFSQEFARQMASTLCDDDTQIDWLPGGHAFAAAVRPIFQYRLIVSAVQELIAKQDKRQLLKSD